jgi:hypothetical protein
LRFGAGWVEFQLQRNDDERTTLWEICEEEQLSLDDEPRLATLNRRILEGDVQSSAPIAAPTVIRNPFLSQHHPMWDRWLDA